MFDRKHTFDERKDLKLKYHKAVAEVSENVVDRFLCAFSAVLEHGNYGPVLEHYSKVAGRCSRCTVACPVFQRTGASKDIPCARSELLIEVYKRYFTVSGRILGRTIGGFELTKEHVLQMAEDFWRCNACRKCNRECPFGLDHGLLTHLGRYLLSESGIAPKALEVSVEAQMKGEHRNTSAIPFPALLDTIEFLEEELEEKTGRKIPFPVDQAGAEYIFFAPVSDYLMEADTLMGNAAVLYAGGVSWTIGSKYADAINYGLFYNDGYLEDILHMMAEEARRLRVKKVLIGECGHASRSAKAFMESLGGKYRLPVVNCLELAHSLLKQGKIRLDPNKVTQRCTYHDPCNIARTGWIVEQPREIIRSFIKDFVEMTPNKTDNYCCGGGGGIVSMDETAEFRMEVSGYRKVKQLEETGAKILIAPCANCKKQLNELINHHGLDMEVQGLHNLLLEALVLPEITSGTSETKVGCEDDPDKE